jgi:hypothetical protein
MPFKIQFVFSTCLLMLIHRTTIYSDILMEYGLDVCRQLCNFFTCSEYCIFPCSIIFVHGVYLLFHIKVYISIVICPINCG